MYPKIIIYKDKLKENTDLILEMCKKNGIDQVTVVVKAFAGNLEAVELLKNTSVTDIGDSRIQNLIKYHNLGFKSKTLLRVPMLSEIAEVVKYCDISLNSEIEVIRALNLEAKRQNLKHKIILMFDLGDLREGLYYTDGYLSFVKEVTELSNICLLGIGTNLTCYGGVVPSKKILSRLVDIKENIENNLQIKLDIISGGNSSTVTLFDQNVIPKEINHLRLGESILFGKETSYSNEIVGLNHDVFELVAQIIELKEKPSYPDGEMSINSFGEVPDIEDLGIMNRAILAIGKQDVILDNLVPKDPLIKIIGGSSDHLIIDVTKGNYKVGDLISFHINYPALVHLMNSNYVDKEYI